MIDYDKLQQAHEIMQKHNKFYCTYEFGWSYKVKFELFNEENDNCIYFTHNIDELITKLQELTTPQPKYKKDDQVWFIDGSNQIATIVVEQARVGKVIDYISEDYLPIEEKYLYSTKAKLIEAQIKRWSDLSEDKE